MFTRKGFAFVGLGFSRRFHAANRNKMIIVMTLAMSSSLAATPTRACSCKGVSGTICGTIGPDLIYGTHAADVIQGNGGDDTIIGRGGNDLICGGGGDDYIEGNDGDDVLFGGTGNDYVSGGRGSDFCAGEILVGCETAT